MAELTTVTIDEITVDQELQVRQSLHDEKVEEYAQRMKDGAHFPPIYCGTFGGTVYVVDGFHRLAAYKACGINNIEVRIQAFFTRNDMYEYAFRANNIHGINLTDEEIREGIIRIIKMHPEESQRKLAERCGCGRTTIQRYQNQLAQVGQFERPEKTIGKDGKERPATRPTGQTSTTQFCAREGCGVPIWEENKGDTNYTYTERNGQWFCSEECAEQWEQEQLSDEAEAITGIPDELSDIPSAALPTDLNSLPVCDMEEPDIDSLPIAEDDEPDDNAVVVECIIPIRVPGTKDPDEAFKMVREQLPLDLLNGGSKFQIKKAYIYLNNLNLNNSLNTYIGEKSENFTEWFTIVIHGKKVSRKYVTKAKFEEWQKEYAGKINVAQCLTDWCKYWNDRRGEDILSAGRFWTCVKSWLDKCAKEADGQRNHKSPYRDESGLTSQEGY